MIFAGKVCLNEKKTVLLQAKINDMKKYVVFFLMLLCCTIASAQMSDQQVLKFIQQEHKAGKSQSQIMTALVQRGVNVDQIRRLRRQYDKQLKDRGVTVSTDGTVNVPVDRLKANNDGTATQELNTAKVGTTGTVTADASAQVENVER